MPSVAARAAANSMASGMPSSRRQIAAIVGRSSARGDEVRLQRLRSGDEKLHRAVPQDVVRVHRFRGRHFERRNAIDVLAVDPQNFAARRQYRGARAPAHEHLRQVRHRIDDVLAVIEHQQKMLSADGSRDGLGGNRFAAELQAEHAGHRGRHEVGIGQRGQFDKPAAVRQSRQGRRARPSMRAWSFRCRRARSGSRRGRRRRGRAAAARPLRGQ